MQLKNSIESNSLPIVYAISYRIACFTLRQATLTSCLSVRPSVHSSAVDKFADSATSSSHVFSVCPLCRCLTVYCGGAAPVPHLVTGSQWLPDIQVLLSRSHCTKRICISLLLKWFCIAAKATWRKRRNKKIKQKHSVACENTAVEKYDNKKWRKRSRRPQREGGQAL